MSTLYPGRGDVGGRSGLGRIAEDAAAGRAADKGDEAIHFVIAGDDEEDVVNVHLGLLVSEADVAPRD